LKMKRCDDHAISITHKPTDFCMHFPEHISASTLSVALTI
jgi:hypothetical protein